MIIKSNWYDHVKILQLTLQKLKDDRLKCNIEKLFFVQTEMEYLGFWVNRNGTWLINNKL